MEKKLKITNANQFETLIAELENNPTLAKGFHRGTSPNNFKQDWEEIAIKLNSIGPPIRDSDGWQKVWRDFKFKVRKKLHNKESIKATGSGRCKKTKLHPLEEAVANLIQFQKKPNIEDEITMMQYAVNVKTENCSVLHEDEYLQSTMANEIEEQDFLNTNRKKRKQSRKSEERQELLEKVFSEISYTMVEVRNVLNESCRYQQKLCEVEEKKLKMMNRQHERDEELFESEMKLKNIKILLKTKELELLEKQSKS